MTKRTPLGALLQAQREAAGLSRPELARRSGVDFETLKSYETGRVSDPPFSRIKALAEELGITLTYLDQLADEMITGSETASTAVDAAPGAAVKARARALLRRHGRQEERRREPRAQQSDA